MIVREGEAPRRLRLTSFGALYTTRWDEVRSVSWLLSPSSWATWASASQTCPVLLVRSPVGGRQAMIGDARNAEQEA